MNILALLSPRRRAGDESVRSFQNPAIGRLEAREGSPGAPQKAPDSGPARTFLLAVTFALLALSWGGSFHGTLWGALPFSMALLIIRTTTLPLPFPIRALQKSASPSLQKVPYRKLDVREATS